MDVTASRALGVDDVRRTNLSRLLRHVHLAGPATRADLTAALGLSRSAVGSLLRELVARGLVREGRPEPRGGRGRPSVVVHPTTDRIAVLALEVQVDALVAATVTVGGATLGRTSVARAEDDAGVDPWTLIDEIAAIARPLLDDLGARRLHGVGVSVAGVVRHADGLVRLAPNLAWRDVPFGDLLRTALDLDVQVTVGNDADLGALAEHRRGAGTDVDHLVYVVGEVGVGGGVILGGRPLRGLHGYAGEIGHVVVRPDGRPCRCGSRGCLETEVGEHALLRAAGRSGGGRDAVADTAAAARAGDARATAAFDRVGRWLGVGLADLVNLVNPERVVLGGLFARVHDLLAPSALDALAAHALAPNADDVTVVPAALGDGSALTGAAEAAFDRLLADPTLSARPGDQTARPRPEEAASTRS